MNTEKQIAQRAAAFASRWQGRGYEKGDSQPFWMELLADVFGVDNAADFIRFEEQVKVDKTNFIDGHIAATKVLIEQKSIDKDLRKGIIQSDGSVLNPFQQAKRYSAELPYSERPRWIVTCNFSTFLIYDMEQPHGEPEEIRLADLGREYYRLLFLVDSRSEHLKKEMQVSMQAGEIVGRIYEALLNQYGDDSPEVLRWLNILCVRIVFCLYAEDAGIFRHDQFHDYLAKNQAEDIRRALRDLFEVMNTPLDKRSKYLKDDLKAFPYTNGGLFTEDIEIPQFTEELKQVLLENASLDFDWSEISPTIFGAVFESTLNPVTRRSGGMHYTSIENIHKVIDPLFLNDLRKELDDILQVKVEKQRQRKLDEYQNRLASLTFLDPACGSGNFLTETYLSLRRLENEVIRERYHGQTMMGAFKNPIKVSIHQFYGIEINDFAVTVATTALWISEAQMLAETERIIHQDIDFLPLKSYTNIREGNALRMEWDVIEVPSDVPMFHIKNAHYIYEEEYHPMAGESALDYEEANLVVDNYQRGLVSNAKRYEIHYDYIIGNPPFVGYSLQNKEQKDDLLRIFLGVNGKSTKTAGKIDYVAGWYYKASQLISYNPHIRAALVSTNSITQGEQVASIWKPLKEMFGIHIDFAYRTFRWDSEASQKAHVHCVIIGFGKKDVSKVIYDNDKQKQAKNINAYLIDAPDVYVGSRNKAICDVPPMLYGNKPVDGGFLFLTPEERLEALDKEPGIDKYIKRVYGSAEYINNKERYCLWLTKASPSDLRNSPFIRNRIEKVHSFRLNSPKKATQMSADTSMLFQEVRQPDSEYMIVPRVSSENRKYVPMGFVSPNIVVNDSVQIIPNATLYHFGILESNVHMAWMRAVCGRLKSDYRYSKDVVYNNFPWPSPTDAQKVKIEQTAQAILDARNLYPESSLADLYDDLTMPIELRRAHQQNDRAVMEAYGFDTSILDSQLESPIVEQLFKMYQTLTKQCK
ncbi:MAG: class I SAM-dependent DNA methyltransferase [Prevotella sp.]|nr:class I SAM-dependent DNA methyltransferase [Prevotella sp.]